MVYIDIPLHSLCFQILRGGGVKEMEKEIHNLGFPPVCIRHYTVLRFTNNSLSSPKLSRFMAHSHPNLTCCNMNP